VLLQFAACTATAANAFRRHPSGFKFTGLHTTAHGAQLPIEVTYTDKESVITKGLENWTTVNEELYNNVTGKLEDTAKELARASRRARARTAREGRRTSSARWTNT